MPINATNPSSAPAMVYDKWWLNLSIQPPHPDLPVPVTIVLRKYGVGPDGKSRFDPLTAPVVFRVDDLFASAATDPDLALIINSLLAKVQAIASARHLI